jgi:hypothetical protein
MKTRKEADIPNLLIIQILEMQKFYLLRPDVLRVISVLQIPNKNNKVATRFRSPNIFKDWPKDEGYYLYKEYYKKGYGNDKEQPISDNEKFNTTQIENANKTYWLQDGNNKMFQTVISPKNTGIKTNNFHKIGTVLDQKSRKISVVAGNNSKRNTKFDTFLNTQCVVNNLLPVKYPVVYRKNKRESAISPQPQRTPMCMAMSPWNISEFAEESDEDQSESAINVTRNEMILNQFRNQRKAVSPNLKNTKRTLNKFLDLKNEDTNYPGSRNNSRNNEIINNLKNNMDSDYQNNRENSNNYTTFNGGNQRCLDKYSNNQMLTIARPLSTARGLKNEDNSEWNQKKWTPSKYTVGVRNTNLKQPRYKFGKNPKLAPLKYNNATIDVKLNGRRFGEKVKIEREKNISVNSPKQYKSNRRYIDSEFENNSDADSFDLEDRIVETNLFDRLNQSIKDFGIDENGRFVGKGSKESTISNHDVKSYAKLDKNSVAGKSEEWPMNQESTVYSNNFEKTPQKNWLMRSSDIFSVGDDEVTHERNNNKEILNLLSESDFEQIKKAIEHDYKKNSINLSKGSHRRAFSSCVEDPKAEDADSL